MKYASMDGLREYMSELPEGVTSFTVNSFSATLKGSSSDVVSSGGICRDARAELLYSGLLCRGCACI